MQAVRLGDDGHWLHLLVEVSVLVRQTSCDVGEHIVDAAPGCRRHRVRRVHNDRQLAQQVIDVKPTHRVRRHAVRATTAQEVDGRDACAVRRCDSHVVGYGRQRQSVVDAVADDDGGRLLVVVRRQRRVSLYTGRVPQLYLNTTTATSVQASICSKYSAVQNSSSIVPRSQVVLVNTMLLLWPLPTV